MQITAKYLFQCVNRRIAMTHDAECWKMVPNVEGEYAEGTVIPLARVANLVREQIIQKQERKAYKALPELYIWKFIDKRVWGNDWVRATIYEREDVDKMIAYIMQCIEVGGLE